MTPSPINMKPPGQPVRPFRALGVALQNEIYPQIQGPAKYRCKQEFLEGIQPEHNQNLLVEALKWTR